MTRLTRDQRRQRGQADVDRRQAERIERQKARETERERMRRQRR